jgi:hypothetical protein
VNQKCEVSEERNRFVRVLTENSHMRRFRLYRQAPPDGYLEEGLARPVNDVQIEGIVFSDGQCVVRWMTGNHSTAVWPSFQDFEAIHGHPEYETVIEWLDAR